MNLFSDYHIDYNCISNTYYFKVLMSKYDNDVNI